MINQSIDRISVPDMVQERLDKLKYDADKYWNYLKFAETGELKMEWVNKLAPIYNEMHAWFLIQQQQRINEREDRENFEVISKYATEIVKESVGLVEQVLEKVKSGNIPSELYEKLYSFKNNYSNDSQDSR